MKHFMTHLHCKYMLISTLIIIKHYYAWILSIRLIPNVVVQFTLDLNNTLPTFSNEICLNLPQSNSNLYESIAK